LVSFAALVSYGVLLIFVVKKDNKSRLIQSFAIYMAAMILWSFSSFMIFADLDLYTTLGWNRLLVVGSTAMPVAFLGFLEQFLGRKKRGWRYFGILAWAATTIINQLGYIVTSSAVSNGVLTYEIGWGVVLPSMIWMVYIALSAKFINDEYVKSRNAEYRNRLRYLFFVILVIFIGSLTNIIPLKRYPVDISLNVLSAMIIVYAIFRHQLLDITIVIRRGLAYSLLTGSIGAAYFMILSVMLQIFTVQTQSQIFLLSVLLSIMVAIIVQPVRDRAQALVDRVFFRVKYDSGLMLQRISSLSASSTLNLEHLINTIIDEVKDTLHIENIAFFIKNDKASKFELFSQRGLDPELDLQIEFDHPIIKHFSISSAPLSKQELEVSHRFSGLWQTEWVQYHELKAEIYIPLKVQGELIAMFAAGPKLSELPYSQDDQQTLITLSNQAAVAIENARLFDQVKEALSREKQFNQVTQTISGALNLEKLFEKVVQQACEIVDAEGGLIALADQNNQKIQYPYIYNLPKGSFRFPAQNGKGMVWKIINTGEPHFSNSVEFNQDAIPELAGIIIYSMIGAPVRAGETNIGGMVLFRFSPDKRFETRDLETIESIGSQAGIALQNARLYKETTDSLLRERKLKEVISAVDRSFEEKKVLESIVEVICNIFNAEIVSIALFDKDNCKLTETVHHGSIKAGDEKTSKVLGGLLSQVYFQEDHAEQDSFLEPIDHKNILANKEFLGSPVFSGLNRVGALGIVNKKGSFDLSDHLLIEMIGRQIGIAIENNQLYEELENSYLQTIASLANAVDLRDTYTNDHSQRLAYYAKEIALLLECSSDEVESVQRAAILHDIGKIGIPDKILLKPGPLTDDEWKIMRKHPDLGADVIEPIKGLTNVAPIIRYHQERYDGSGYPHQLKGEDIPLGARILAVVDVFGALTDDRVYRKAYQEKDAIKKIKQKAGSDFDPKVVQAFLEVLKQEV